jgi:CHAT domain-containing protein
LPELLAKPAPTAEPSLLLVGNVNFNAASSAPEGVATNRSAPRSGGLGKWERLAGTQAEIAAIKDSFLKHYQNAQVSELDAGGATEEAVRQQAPKHRYLHLATHGFFAPPQLRSALATASRGELFARQDMAYYHPGLLSGLVLTGANRKPQADQDDGILTALEVTELELSGVDLATLSACETGLGERRAGGEGLLGLQRAFQAAGARTVVASLWKVDDATSRRLMALFYQNLWEKKLPKLEALRQAQLSVLYGDPSPTVPRGGLEVTDEKAAPTTAARAHPSLWAAWVLSGDPGDLSQVKPVAHPIAALAVAPVSSGGSSSSWTLAGVVGLLVAFGLALWSVRNPGRARPRPSNSP